MSAHTPGPWHNRGAQVLTSPRNVIAEVYRPGTFANQEANLALITAAPELLDALKWAADKLYDVSEWSAANCEPLQAKSVKAVEEMARVAIAKTEGRA